MTYTFKLARRLSQAHIVGIVATALLMGSCAPGQPLDGGLEPPPPDDVLAIQLFPDSVSLNPSEFVDFTAVAELNGGGNGQVPVEWEATGGTITADGRYTASDTAGKKRVIGRYRNGKADSSVVVINPSSSPVLTGIAVTPSSAALIPGDGEQFSATGVMSDGGSTSVSVDWSTTGGTISASGSYTAPATAGNYVVVATLQGGTFSDTAQVSVAVPPPTLAAVILTPATTALQFTQTQQFLAQGRLTDGSLVGLGVTWTATGGSVSAGGLYRAGSTAGTFRVIARSATGLADTSSVTITAPTITAINLTPASVSLQSGQAQQFSASATLSNGGTQTNPAVTWSATGGAINTTGLYTAGATAGSFRVIAASANGRADTSAVTISSPTVTTITVTPATVSLSGGQTQQFAASATLSNGATQSNPAVTWSATGGTVSTGGLYTAGTTAGSFRVIAASSNGRADTSAVTITAATVTAVTVTPATASLSGGQTQQFTASATLSDGTTQSNPAVTWSATGGTISTSGLYTAGATAGTTFRVIAASGNGRADTSAVTITAATITAITVTPATASLSSGQTQQFTATATLSTGGTQANPAVTWSATGGTINTSGLYSAGTTAGSFRVIAASGNGRADTSAVTITAVTITAITVTPATVSLSGGQTRQFTATATLSTGGTQTNPAVTWSATGGTISTGGLYTAGATAGAFTVTAQQSGGTIQGAAAVTITPPPVLQSITVSPSTVTVQAGNTQAFSATGHFADGSTGAVAVTWAATGGTIGGSSGVFTAGTSPGQFTVTASLTGGTIQGSASVTVTSAPPIGNVPELPSGYVLRATHTGSPLVPSGWLTNSDGTSGVTVFDDPQAPSSPSQVMRVNYPAGMGDGSAPVGMEFPGTNGASRLFATYWFKYNPTFQGHDSQVNKHLFVFGANGTVLVYSEMRFVGNASQGNMDFQFQGGMASPTYDKRLVDNYGGNHLSIAKDQWHRVSLELIHGSNSSGIVRAWVDGVKVGEITNANFATGIGVVKIDPTWGGNSGDVMTQAGYLYFDEVRFYTQ